MICDMKLWKVTIKTYVFGTHRYVLFVLANTESEMLNTVNQYPAVGRDIDAEIESYTEIDLTDYKISKRTNYQNANFSIVFEKKFRNDYEGVKAYDEYEHIISASKIYAATCASMPHLIPVANFKINDIFI